MKEYLADVQEVMEQQQTGEEGLSSREAGERLQKYGKNKLKEGKKESLIHKFLMELKDPMVLKMCIRDSRITEAAGLFQVSESVYLSCRNKIWICRWSP